nr:helix-turn-helix domain-containing protein [Brucella intermedia]
MAKIIRDKRLDRAYRILVDERGRHVSLKEITYRCGFHDGTQFTKAFKARFACRRGTLAIARRICLRRCWTSSTVSATNSPLLSALTGSQ